MNCDFCDKMSLDDSPLLSYKIDGTFKYGCIACFKKEGLYCKKHKKVHLGYGDKTHVCTECIETELARMLITSMSSLYTLIEQGIVHEKFAPIEKHCEQICEMLREPEVKSLTREIIRLRHRRDISLHEAVHLVRMSDNPFELLFPSSKVG